MISGATLFAALGILAGIAALACGTVRAFAVRFEGVGTAPTDTPASGSLRAAARLCLGLSCLFALAAFGALWLGPEGRESALGLPRPSAWGALWVHVLALPVEWRLLGLPGAWRRALAGWLVAGVGVLFLGIGLGVWTGIDPHDRAACPDGTPAIDANALAVGAVAALGLALVPLSCLALRLARPAAPPLSAAGASVAAAVWLQPALPALGWLPTSLGGGAALALLLVAALTLPGFAASRGPGAAALGVSGYFALSVGGCLVLGIM